jgi:hypothetical protein
MVLRELFGMSTNITELLLKCPLHCSIFNVIRTGANTYRLINNLMSYYGYLLRLHTIRIIICPADGCLASWINFYLNSLCKKEENDWEHFFLGKHFFVIYFSWNNWDNVDSNCKDSNSFKAYKLRDSHNTFYLFPFTLP